MANKWVLFVKKWAEKHGTTYGCALSNPQLKKDYRKFYPTKQQEQFKEAVERGEMGDEDIRSKAVENDIKQKVAERKKKIQTSKDRLGMIQEDLLSKMRSKVEKQRELEKKKLAKKKVKPLKKKLIIIESDSEEDNLF